MDVRSFSRHDIGMLFAAVGNHGRLFLSMVLRAVIEEHGLHLHVDRAGRGYVLVAVETCGDAVVGEHRLAIVWDAIDEDIRFGVLHLYVGGLVEGHARWLRRHRLPLGMVAANDGSSSQK